MIALITSNPPVQGYATHKLYSVLAAKSNQPVLLQLGVWCIGEYGELLVGSAPPEGTEGETPDQVAVVKLLEEVRTGHVTKSAWELRVKQFMAEGHIRRAHLLSLVSIEVLRGVTFGAKELHDGGLCQARNFCRGRRRCDARLLLRLADANSRRRDRGRRARRARRRTRAVGTQ